jgi:hypothetical protein
MSNPFSDPPPLPPKQYPSSRRQYQQHQSSKSNPNPRVDTSQAHYPSRPNDPPPRTRPSRSQTAGLPYVVFIFSLYRCLIILHLQKKHSQPTNTSSRSQPPPARRSHSSDSVPSDKAKHHRSKAKKSSIHADVIDRLDFTGVGPSTTFSVQSSISISHLINL